jgi:hypothetical protein
MTMVVLIPVIVENPLTTCGYKKFQVYVLDDHLCTCTTHSGTKKTQDWSVDQLADLYIVGTAYLANATGPVSLVLDLRIDHDRFGCSL